MATRSETTQRVNAVNTMFEIVDTLHSMNGASLAELAHSLDFAKSTILSHLVTLEDREYVIRNDNEYQLSLKFLYHGMFTKNNLEIPRMGQPIIEDLAEETGEVTWIVVEEHGRAVYLNKAMGERAVQTHAAVGRRAHLHHLAAGKSILANFPEERVDEIIKQHGLPKKTSNTITDPSALKDELEQIQEKGFAINDKEIVEGLRAIGAPVFSEGRVCGAMCVSGPANRLSLERCQMEIKPRLLEATNELELKLQYPHR